MPEILPYQYRFAVPGGNISRETQVQIQKWMEINGTQSVAYSALYVILIFLGKWFMRTRERYELRTALVIWSGALAVFSIVGAMHSIPEMVHIIYNYGFHATLVDDSYYQGVAGFWSVLFIWSKPWELGDTAFIVLRKQPLIFLHWYHHITVMLYCWLYYAEESAPGRWFMTMNYSVHALMYTYYTLRAAKLRVPRAANILVTSLQIAQMVMGLFIFCYVYWCRHFGDKTLKISENSVVAGFLMYLSYFILFSNFFYHTYVKKQPRVVGRAAPPSPPPEPSDEEVLAELQGVSKAPQLDGRGVVSGLMRAVADIDRAAYVKKEV